MAASQQPVEGQRGRDRNGNMQSNIQDENHTERENKSKHQEQLIGSLSFTQYVQISVWRVDADVTVIDEVPGTQVVEQNKSGEPEDDEDTYHVHHPVNIDDCRVHDNPPWVEGAFTLTLPDGSLVVNKKHRCVHDTGVFTVLAGANSSHG